MRMEGRVGDGCGPITRGGGRRGHAGARAGVSIAWRKHGQSSASRQRGQLRPVSRQGPREGSGDRVPVCVCVRVFQQWGRGGTALVRSRLVTSGHTESATDPRAHCAPPRTEPAERERNLQRGKRIHPRTRLLGPTLAAPQDLRQPYRHPSPPHTLRESGRGSRRRAGAGRERPACPWDPSKPLTWLGSLGSGQLGSGRREGGPGAQICSPSPAPPRPGPWE